MSLTTADLYELDAIARAKGLSRSQAALEVRKVREQGHRDYAKVAEGWRADNQALRALVLDHVQGLAIEHNVWRGTAAELAKLVAQSGGIEQSTEIESLLHDEDLRRELLNHRDAALYRGADRRFRLIDQTPLSLAAATLRAQHQVLGHACRYCWLDESKTPDELEQDLDLAGNTIPGSYVHEVCRRAWRRIRGLGPSTQYALPRRNAT